MLGEHDDLLALVPRFGCDPLEQNYNFAEICHRSRKRWDMRVPGEAVSALTSAAVQASLPVILGLDRLPLHPDEGRLPLARRLPAGKQLIRGRSCEQRRFEQRWLTARLYRIN